jgi:hypothetical protein
MSIAYQFWQYAKEAILSAAAAKTEGDRRSLLELARTWTQAALLERQRAPLKCGAIHTKILFRKSGNPPSNTSRISLAISR